MTSFKGTTELGGLYFDGVAQPRATRPWLVDLTDLKPYDGLEPGNIARFDRAPDWSRWRIGDTPAEPSCRLRWIEIEHHGKRLLICDRVILVYVSWYDLDRCGLVSGSNISIDQESYQCRLMSGGCDFRTGEDGYSAGTPHDNEWDLFVARGQDVLGLPVPTATDLDDVLSETDRLSDHNRFWNWFGAVSWTATPYARKKTARVCRGYRAAQYFYLNTFDHRHEDIGWRPVLERQA